MLESRRPRVKMETLWPRATACLTRWGPMNPVPPRMRMRMGARARSGAAAARKPGAAEPTSTEPPKAAEVFRKSRLLGICWASAGQGWGVWPRRIARPQDRNRSARQRGRRKEELKSVHRAYRKVDVVKSTRTNPDAVMVSTFGMVNTLVLTQPRLLYAIADAGFS